MRNLKLQVHPVESPGKTVDGIRLHGGGSYATASASSGVSAGTGSVSLSSPESAYSTGYSTDGTSPGTSFPPEYYINIRTGTHYFQSSGNNGRPKRSTDTGELSAGSYSGSCSGSGSGSGSGPAPGLGSSSGSGSGSGLGSGTGAALLAGHGILEAAACIAGMTRNENRSANARGTNATIKARTPIFRADFTELCFSMIFCKLFRTSRSATVREAKNRRRNSRSEHTRARTPIISVPSRSPATRPRATWLYRLRYRHRSWSLPRSNRPENVLVYAPIRGSRPTRRGPATPVSAALSSLSRLWTTRVAVRL